MSEYASVSRGALKFKGDGVEKKKKKKKPKPADATKDESSTSDPAASKDAEGKSKDKDLQKMLADEEADDREAAMKEYEKYKLQGGKTEAERRYEERRRQRLEERLRREGVKTHKERVEELNRYLSRLSEHHDMPRIGPG